MPRRDAVRKDAARGGDATATPVAAAGRASETQASAIGATLDALLDALPDGLILCDPMLMPVRAGAAAAWLLDEQGGWARSAGATQTRAAVAAALDRGGVAARRFEAAGKRWEVRAAPFSHASIAAVAQVREADDVDARSRDAVLRAAHDLKAPLHAIEGFAGLLLAGAEGSAETRREMLELVAAETRRLRALLERVLEEARGGGTARPAESTGVARGAGTARLTQLARTVVTRLAGAARAREVRLRMEAPDTDELLVGMLEDEAVTVIENLLTNALDASAPAGEVVLSIAVGRGGAGREGADAVRCTVLDRGPGLPEAALEQIFEPYFRLDQGSGRGTGSTGLGLAISRGLVEARGGVIRAANRAGGGASFWFELPVASEEAAAWPLVRVAPVTSHAALAAASAALDRHAPCWRIASWENGVLVAELMSDLPAAEAAAAAIAAGRTFSAWVV